MKTFSVLLTVLVLILTSCTPASAPTPTNTALAPTPLSQIPDGSYMVSFTKEEFASLGDAAACDMAGTYKLVVFGKNFTTTHVPIAGCKLLADFIWEGSLDYTGDQVGFNSMGITSCTPMIPAYKWSLDGKQLRFSKGKDCDNQRMTVLTKYPLVKQ